MKEKGNRNFPSDLSFDGKANHPVPRSGMHRPSQLRMLRGAPTFTADGHGRILPDPFSLDIVPARTLSHSSPQ
jgi:hypothetical protein